MRRDRTKHVITNTLTQGEVRLVGSSVATLLFASGEEERDATGPGVF